MGRAECWLDMDSPDKMSLTGLGDLRGLGLAPT